MRGFFVGLLGLEPRKTAPKTVVLPLHHRPFRNSGANIRVVFISPNNFKKISNNFMWGIPSKFILFVALIPKSEP